MAVEESVEVPCDGTLTQLELGRGPATSSVEVPKDLKGFKLETSKQKPV